MEPPIPIQVPIQVPDLRLYSRRLFGFILSIILLMSVGFALISSFLIKDSLDQFYSSYVDLEATYLEDSLNEVIKSKLSNMKDIASLPLIVNSVMHPEHDHGFLEDFMEDLNIQESRVKYVLLDINGNVIQSNAADFSLDWRGQDWINHLIEGDQPQFVQLLSSDDKTMVLIAVPVNYNRHPEGVLVGLLPSNLEQRFSKLLQDRPLFAVIYSNGTLVEEFGAQRQTESSKVRIDLPLVNGALEVEIYKTEIDQILFNLTATVLVVVGTFSLIFVLVFRRLGQTLFVKPQKMIEESVFQSLETNRKLSAVNDELAQFAYRASHDLKAPLVTTRGLADCILMDIEDGDLDEVKINASKIGEHVDRLEKLVVDILDLARADLEVSSKEAIDLEYLVVDIRKRLEKSCVDNDVSVEVEIDPLFELFASKTRVTQVLENLISNAIKYHDPKKLNHFVKINATCDSDWSEIRVSDNGLGIPEEFSQQVFQMFQRFHPNVSYGSGLGMYIVKKHVDSMQAEMSYNSSTAGTEFIIAIPKT